MSTSWLKQVVSFKEHWREAIPLLLIWLTFLGYSFYRAPIPAVNEPHYLTKAFHYWQPDWCPQDLFLNSSNAHLVFYQTVGALTQFFSFTTSAIVGRLTVLFLFALGWLFCMRRVLGCGWNALIAVWFFLTLTSLGNFSGEWVVGGIESKVLAYAFLLFSLGYLVRNEFKRAALFCGLTICLHPVIGVWATASILGTLGWNWSKNLPTPSLKELTVSGGLLLMAAAPGLVPALKLVGGGDPQSDWIQVYFRLGHHLDPMRFPATAYLYYAFLIAVWLKVRSVFPSQASEAIFSRFVTVTLLIACCGIVVGGRTGTVDQMWLASFRTGLLKFYFFRLADTFIPIVTAIQLTRLMDSWHRGELAADWQFASRTRQLVYAIVFIGIAIGPFVKVKDDRDPSYMRTRQRQDWLTACAWIDDNAAPDSLFLTPRKSWAFKWYAKRSEYFSFKNMPQDADSLIEWYNRHQYQREWVKRVCAESKTTKPVLATKELVQELQQQTEATHYLLHKSMKLPLPPVYENRTYAIYQFPKE